MHAQNTRVDVSCNYMHDHVNSTFPMHDHAWSMHGIAVVEKKIENLKELKNFELLIVGNHFLKKILK